MNEELTGHLFLYGVQTRTIQELVQGLKDERLARGEDAEPETALLESMAVMALAVINFVLERQEEFAGRCEEEEEESSWGS